MSSLHSDVIVAGSPSDFMQVRHIVLRGSQRSIGRELSTIALRDLGVRKVPWTDATATSEQLSWLRDHWPAHHQRSLGVADALELSPGDHSIDPTFLYYYWAVPGCSNVYWPPASTADGHAVLSRNYDFSTGTVFELMGLPEPPDAVDATSAPFIVETRPTGPDAGYATLTLTSYELLGGAADGINSQGLGVALMSTADVMRAPDYTPLGRNGVGVHEIQLIRFLLENAATAQEARTLLESTPQVTVFVACHFLVADARGDSFLWSHDVSRDAPVRLQGHPERPLCATNHIEGHSVADIPERDESVERCRQLTGAVDEALREGPADRGAILAASRSVAATLPAGQGQYVSDSLARTLWHSLYDLTERTLSVDFYLGEGEDGAIRRSPRVELGL